MCKPEESHELVVVDKRASALVEDRGTQLPAEAVEQTSPGGLLLAAMQQGLPTEQLELFLTHHREAIERDQRASYAEALSRAQGEYGRPVKTAKSDRGMYAPMDQDVAAIREANARHGISYFHRVESRVIDGTTSALVRVQCIVRHDGHDEAHPAMETVAAESKGMSLIRSIKSAVTFLRRLTLEAAFGLAPEDDDDDGQAHQGSRREPEPEQRQRSAEPEISKRARTAISTFRRVGISRQQMEGKIGLTVDEWTDETYQMLTRWRDQIKQAGGTAEQRATARELFGMGEREPGEEG